MRRWATMRRPAFSRQALTSPVMLRRVASGLRIERVRSIAMDRGLVGQVRARRGVIVEIARRCQTRSGRGCQSPARCHCPSRVCCQYTTSCPASRAAPPAAAGVGDRRLVLAVEQQQAALEGFRPVVLGTVDENQHRRRVGVFLRRRQEDRLRGRVAVPGGAVGQEGTLPVGPQQSVERRDALLRRCQDQGAEAALDDALK